MLKDKKIKIYISYRNYTHYVKLGYNPLLNELLEIKTIDLPSVSHQKVVAICEICSSEVELMYCKYLDNKKRHGFYGCKSCSRQKAALTSLEKWGCVNYSLTDEYKKRVEETNIKKFGYKTNLLNPDYQKLIKENLKKTYGTENFWEIPKTKDKKRFKYNEKVDILKSDLDLDLSESKYDYSYINKEYFDYRRECRRLTKQKLKSLMNNWDGTDYYDSEIIEENFNLDHNDPGYPTIDHKVSIYYGFKNKIDPKEIAKLDNLCITKRSINSAKRDLCEEEFLDLTNHQFSLSNIQN